MDVLLNLNQFTNPKTLIAITVNKIITIPVLTNRIYATNINMCSMQFYRWNLTRSRD